MRFSAYETLGNHTASGDPALAHGWVAFDFGDGGHNSTGELMPGVANEAIADYLQTHAMKPNETNGETVWRPTAPIYAQILVANALMQACPGLIESDMFTIVGKPADDGQYVDPWKVATEAAQSIPWSRNVDPVLTPGQELRQQQGMPAGRIAVAAVAQHVGRARWQTQRAFGSQAEVYTPAGLPKTYAGPNSTQAWTTRPFALSLNPNKSWWPRELITRALAFIGGGPTNPKDFIAVKTFGRIRDAISGRANSKVTSI